MLVNSSTLIVASDRLCSVCFVRLLDSKIRVLYLMSFSVVLNVTPSMRILKTKFSNFSKQSNSFIECHIWLTKLRSNLFPPKLPLMKPPFVTIIDVNDSFRILILSTRHRANNCPPNECISDLACFLREAIHS